MVTFWMVAGVDTFLWYVSGVLRYGVIGELLPVSASWYLVCLAWSGLAHVITHEIDYWSL